MSREDVIREFLKERFGNYSEEMGIDEPLEGVVDSLGLFELVTFVEQEFSISISNDEFSPDSFSTIGNILITIEEHQVI